MDQILESPYSHEQNQYPLVSNQLACFRACTTLTFESVSLTVFRGISKKYIRDGLFMIFLCILCLSCIYYNTNLRDDLLYSVVS
jgi:hypothetical protein